MQKLSLVITIILFVSCNTNNNSSYAPDICDCFKNIRKLNTDDFNEELNKKCQEYSATLTLEKRIQRAMKESDCSNE